MSVFNFIWDAAQDGHIDELTEEIEELKKRVQILEDWIRYLESKNDLPIANTAGDNL